MKKLAITRCGGSVMVPYPPPSCRSSPPSSGQRGGLPPSASVSPASGAGHWRGRRSNDASAVSTPVLPAARWRGGGVMIPYPPPSCRSSPRSSGQRGGPPPSASVSPASSGVGAARVWRSGLSRRRNRLIARRGGADARAILKGRASTRRYYGPG